METIAKWQAADSWLKLINTSRANGLSDNEWRHRNNISPSTFYYHAKLLHKSAATFHKLADKIVTIQDFVKISVIQDESLAVTGSLSVNVQ
jgi:hypothetical protein